MGDFDIIDTEYVFLTNEKNEKELIDNAIESVVESIIGFNFPNKEQSKCQK